MNKLFLLTILIICTCLQLCDSSPAEEISLDDVDFSTFVRSTKRLNKQTSKKIDEECEQSGKNFKKLFRDTFVTNNSNSGSTHHSRTIGRFTSCRQLTASCEDHCNNRSNKAYTVGPFFLRESDRDTCVDKCHTLEIDCDGGALNEYVLRHYYCQAIYTGASNAYELGKRCENNFSFWQF